MNENYNVKVAKILKNRLRLGIPVSLEVESKIQYERLLTVVGGKERLSMLLLTHKFSLLYHHSVAELIEAEVPEVKNYAYVKLDPNLSGTGARRLIGDISIDCCSD